MPTGSRWVCNSQLTPHASTRAVSANVSMSTSEQDVRGFHRDADKPTCDCKTLSNGDLACLARRPEKHEEASLELSSSQQMRMLASRLCSRRSLETMWWQETSIGKLLHRTLMWSRYCRADDDHGFTFPRFGVSIPDGL